MSNFLPPLGEAQSSHPIQSGKDKPKSFETDSRMLSIPEMSGDSSSPKDVLSNCAKLSESALPSRLADVVKKASDAGGRIFSSSLVADAGHPEETLHVLGAMFTVAQKREE